MSRPVVGSVSLNSVFLGISTGPPMGVIRLEVQPPPPRRRGPLEPRQLVRECDK